MKKNSESRGILGKWDTTNVENIKRECPTPEMMKELGARVALMKECDHQVTENSIYKKLLITSKLNRYHYHTTLYHVVRLFATLDQHEDDWLVEFPDLDFDKLDIVIRYHDIVYVPGSKTNEEDSVRVYKDAHVDSWDQEIVDCILSTKIGVKQFNGSLQKVMHDLDWYGFSHSNILWLNENRIIDENVEVGGFDENKCIEQQLAFYKTIVDTDIFVTKTFAQYNEAAKLNIAARIVALENERSL